jgi:hypothetical protein
MKNSINNLKAIFTAKEKISTEKLVLVKGGNCTDLKRHDILA